MASWGYKGQHKRSVSIGGHATSLRLEPEFWTALQTMADEEDISLARKLAQIDSSKYGRSLASACRVACFKWALQKQPK